MDHLIDELLSHRGVHVGDEAEAAALAIYGVTHNLGILDRAKLLKVA